MKFTFKPFKNGKISQDGESSPDTPANRSQKRREQVRRAQKTHRERKEAYIKSLESDVVELRANEAKLLRETRALRAETNILRRLLTEHNIPLPPISVSDLDDEGSSRSDPIAAQLVELSIRESSPSSGSRSISVQRAAKPQRRQVKGVSPQLAVEAVSPYSVQSGFAHQQASQLSLPAADFEDSHSSLPHSPFNFNTVPLHEPLTTPNAATHVADLDLAVVGMDFILSLESPCLHHTDIPDSPSRAPTGHAQTMTATVLHQHPAFPGHRLTSSATWQVSSDGIDRLLELSKSIPLDGELTPVQAWDYIRCHPQFPELQLAHVEGLKMELVQFVRCHGFGGVLEQSVFEDVVGNAFAVGKVF